MKKRIKTILIVLCACALVVAICWFAGVSPVVNAVNATVSKAKALVGIEEESDDSSYVPPEGATQVTGMVLTAYGNEITVQLEASASSSSAQGGMQEGMTEGMTEGEMSEGMMEGEMPEGMTEGEAPEGMSEGGMSDRGDAAMGEGESAMGGGQASGDSAAMSERQSSGNSATVPEMDSDSAAGSDASASMGGDTASGMGEMSGGMGEMSGGMGEMSGGMGDTATVDYSSIITLGDETQLYVIPTGTIVEYYGFEMTFSQLAAEQYITITLNENGVVLYVEVLG